jgi:hypothetical protein
MNAAGVAGSNSRGAFRQELAWLVVASLIVCSLASVPYLVGYVSQTDSFRYAWVAVAPEDNLSYFAKIGQGQRGSWLFRLPYTARTNIGAPVYLYYLYLGHLANWYKQTPQVIYHLARFANGFALLVVGYLFISLLTKNVAERRYIFTITALSSGLGWLMLPLGRLLSTDLSVPESNTFFSLMDAAHFPLSQALMLVFGMIVIAPKGLTRSMQWGLSLAATLALGLQALIQPFILVVLFGTVSLYAIVTWLRDNRPPLFLLMRLAPGMAIAALLALLTNLSMTRDPILAGWLNQNITLSPPIWDYLSGYGFVLLLAAVGAAWAMHRRSNADIWMLGWVVMTAIALYSPTTLQRRLSQGLHLPLAFLAGLGICRVWIPRWPIARRWLYSRLVLVAMLPTTFVLIGLFAGGAVVHSPKLFISGGEEQALEWLRREAKPDGVVLSSPELGAFIPAFTSQRAVSGHGMETMDADATEFRVRHFFATTTLPAVRQAALAEWDVSYVLLGPREQRLGVDRLSEADGVVAIATFDQLTIYQVRLR